MHYIRPCSTEEDSLSIFSCSIYYLSNLGLKSHIKHTISFIYHQECAPIKRSFTAFYEVNNTAWSGYDDINSPHQTPLLLPLLDSSIETGWVKAKLLYPTMNLHSQFSSGCQYQHNWPLPLLCPWLCSHMNKPWYEKSNCFSWTCLRYPNEISTLQNNWECCFKKSFYDNLEWTLWLYGSRSRVFKLSYLFTYVGGKVKISPFHERGCNIFRMVWFDKYLKIMPICVNLFFSIYFLVRLQALY